MVDAIGIACFAEPKFWRPEDMTDATAAVEKFLHEEDRAP